MADFLHDLVWNIILNYDANCSEETIANHLGIQREFLGDLSFLKNYANGSDVFITNPYFDWDN